MQKIVDSHVHFWDNEKARIDWIREVRELDRPFRPEHLSLEIEGDDIQLEKVVFVQADGVRKCCI